MATYFVASGGSNTSPYDTWAKAATNITTAMAAASTEGDVVVIQYNGVPSDNKELIGNLTITFAATNVVLISASNDGGSSYTPTPMGATEWIGNSTVARIITVTGADRKAQVIGVTFRGAPSLTTLGAHITFEDCLFWTQLSAQNIVIGSTASKAVLMGCTFRFEHAGGAIVVLGTKSEIIGCSVSSAGAVPTNLISAGSVTTAGNFVGCDFSYITSTLVANTALAYTLNFDRCKLGTGVVVLAAQTNNPTGGSPEVYLFDSDVGDTHYAFAHYDALGETTVSTSIYANDGAEWNLSASKYSWKITTTANASYLAPYTSPWIHKHHEGTSAITPYLECLRDNSSGAVFQNDEVWAEFIYKGTTGFVLGTIVNDSMALFGSPADQTASSKGASDWTGETGTAGYFKLNTTATITPTEIGNLSARVCVGEPSITVYVDPQIRT